MSDAFTKLSTPIQQALWDQKWNNLRPMQVEAINLISDTPCDIVIAAATASGKTEAAFLPILSQIDTNANATGINVIYIAPLKALINDQHQRLKDLTVHTEISINRWHGDVAASEKKSVRGKPSGVLQITPESLESCFINYGKRVQAMFGNLEFIVIDELHAFLGDVRGVHLASLLSRLMGLSKARPRLVGLSATLADFDIAKKYLNPRNVGNVRVIEDERGSRSMSIGLRAYPKPIAAHRGTKKSPADLSSPDGLTLLAEEIARVFSSQTNLIFSNSRNLAELLTDHLNQLAIQQRWQHNPFSIHHGSLSKESREDTEMRLKSREKLSVFCTSTLEMGIDIGDVYSIGQLGPPWSVASLVQRIGRSGRNEGASAILRMYALDKEVTKESPLEQRLYPQLIRCIALIELMLERWLEPLPDSNLQISTFIQQIFSILRQTGGVSASKIYQTLCVDGIFNGFSIDDYKATLKDLKAHDTIEQMPEGEIILTPLGERITHDRSFYSAFIGSEDFSVRYSGSSIGNLPSTSLPPVGEHFILNGQRWTVETIESSSRIVDVTPSRAKKDPMFSGSSGNIHSAVFSKMHHILNTKSDYSYLHSDAKILLNKARNINENSLGENYFCSLSENTVILFPWVGTKGLLTFALCAKMGQIDCEIRQVSLVYKASLQSLSLHLKSISDSHFSALDLAEFLPDKHPEKYDEYAPDHLLAKVNAERSLAVDEVTYAARKIYDNIMERSV